MELTVELTEFALICEIWNEYLNFFFTIITWVDFEFFSQDHVLSSPY